MKPADGNDQRSERSRMIYSDNESLAEGVMSSSAAATTRWGSCKGKVALLVGALALAVLVVPIAIASAVAQRSAPKSTTQGPNAATGVLNVDGVGACPYTLLDWTKRFDWDSMSDVFVDGAPQILIFDDLTEGGHGSESHSSSDNPWAIDYGYATSGDGTVVYEYAATTTFDQKVSFSIDGSPYDLSQGGLFLIRTAGGVVEVQQLDTDMPVFFKSDDVDYAIQEFAESNDDIMEFLRETSEQQNRQ